MALCAHCALPHSISHYLTNTSLPLFPYHSLPIHHSLPPSHQTHTSCAPTAHSSLCGLLFSPFFFVFQLLDFIIYNPSGAIVLKSAYVGGPLLIRTGLVGILVIFLYAIVSFLAFAGQQGFVCTTLYECIGLHFVHALASSSIAELWKNWASVPDTMWEEAHTQLRTIFIISFLIVWVFLLQNIFTGQVGGEEGDGREGREVGWWVGWLERRREGLWIPGGGCLHRHAVHEPIACSVCKNAASRTVPLQATALLMSSVLLIEKPPSQICV